MATYYWVGGSGTWNSTDTTNWASSSGGAGGAGVPGTGDDVVFDGNSDTGAPFTVTIGTGAVCRDMDANTATPLDQTMTLAGSAAWSIRGSLFWPISNFTRTYAGVVTFTAIDARTITLNGHTLTGVVSFPSVNFNGVNGEWTLGSAAILTVTSGAVRITSGTLKTANFNLNFGAFEMTNAAGVRIIELGSSTVTTTSTFAVSGWSVVNNGTTTINAGTSTINCSGNGTGRAFIPFNGGGFTYYNVNLKTTISPNFNYRITGANTFNNLTIEESSSSNYLAVDFTDNQTVNGTFSVSPGQTSLVKPRLVTSNVAGTQRTITAAAASIGTGVVFKDIVIAGAAAPLDVSALLVGDAGNNSGITFAAPKTIYWNLAGSQNWSATGWATTPTGVPAAANFPLVQDTAVITESGSAGTITLNVEYPIGTLTFDDGVDPRTSAVTLTFTAAPSFYGDLKLSSGVTISGAATSNFVGEKTQNITSAGKTFTGPVTVISPNGTARLQDAMVVDTARTVTLTSGTIDLNNQNLTTGLFASNNSNTRSIAFGTGKIITKSTGTVWTTATVTGLTVTGTQVVDIDNNTATAVTVSTGALSEANSISFNFINGTYTLTDTAAVYRNLNFTGFAGTIPNSVRTLYGGLIISAGMTLTAGANATTFAATSGTHQITTAGKTLDFPVTVNAPGATVQLQDNLTQGATRTFTLTAGEIDLSNGNRTLSAGLFSSSNSNTRSIAFGTGALTVTGSGTVWNTGTVTGFTRTGTPTVNISNNSATATTVTTGTMSEAQALNFNYTTGTYTLTDTAAVYRNLNFTGFAGTVPNSVRTIYGGLTLEGGATNSSGANATTFAATSGTHQITTDGVTINYPLIFNSNGGTFEFQDALTQGATRAFTITNGTIQFKDSATTTVGVFSTSGSNQKFLKSTTAGVQATLSQASGTVNASNLTIQDINATGGATWNAYVTNENVDAGNNDGWDFFVQLGRYIYTRRKNKVVFQS